MICKKDLRLQFKAKQKEKLLALMNISIKY